LSKQSANVAIRQCGFRGGATALCTLVLAACGSSTPRQAAVEEPVTVIAPQVSEVVPAAAAPVAAAEPQRRRERRGERQAAEAEAAAALASAAEPVPEAALAGYDRALAAMRGGDWLEAELELEQLTVEYPAYPGPHVNLALVYLRDGRRDDARAELDRALAIDPGHAAANNQLGILLREQGKFYAAERAYRSALATDPGHALAHYNLAVLLDVYLRRTAEALEHYESYQSSLAEPNETVGRWIIDLRRRVGNGAAPRVAQEDGQ
jgi:tetratricopeptide (TPR) repeat protein